MKRIILLNIALLLTLNIYAQGKKFTLVSTASIFTDMAKNIVGHDAEVVTIVPVGADPHLYEPTPSDAKLVTNADLIIKNGLTFEGWINELIANSGTKAKVVTITKGINPITSEDDKNSTDPHAWMDVKNSLFYIKNIKDALVAFNPANKEVYEFNYGVYKQALEDLDKKIKSKISSIPAKKRVLITSHDAFQYYGNAYGIRLEAVVGTSTEAEAQTSDIIRLTKTIKANNIPAVFVESTINPKLLNELAKSTGVKIGGELFADSLDDPDKAAGTYIGMMQHNTNTITKALSADPAIVIKTPDTNDANNWMLWGALGLLLLGGFFLVLRRVNQ